MTQYKALPGHIIDGTVTVTGTVIATTTQPTRTTASISSAQATDAIMDNLTALTPKFAKANISSSITDGAVVAAVALKKIRVTGVCILTNDSGPTNVTFTSKPGGAGTAISALFACAANGGLVLPFSPVGWFETTAGQGLSVTTSAGGTTGIQLSYLEV